MGLSINNQSIDQCCCDTGSLARLAVVQSMMAVDSDGNILPPVMMSRSGRYQALNNNNAAFQHINLQDLVNIAEQERFVRHTNPFIHSRQYRFFRRNPEEGTIQYYYHATRGEPLQENSWGVVILIVLKVFF